MRKWSARWRNRYGMTAPLLAVATEHQNALEALHQVLPTVIEKCSAAKYKFADRHITGAIFAAAFGANAANK